MKQWWKVKDYTDTSGNGGFFKDTQVWSHKVVELTLTGPVSPYPDSVGNLRKPPRRIITQLLPYERQDHEARKEQLHLQAQFDWEAMDQRGKAELRVAQRDTDCKQEAAQQDADRKQEWQEAQKLHLNENQQYKESQAAQAKSRQMFESEKLALMSNLGWGSSVYLAMNGGL
ncbi:hypothetical protein VP01_5065g1 [Puccinia sorghi]|uniref:Uncharacterized protein n=1 Tax=Puccinia sorghi TaxID=27349 RepID=A0A0L6ULH0_9BASI|nr:hypothetical protein VP01_5065g1 [Puccinia sorghi]